QTVPGTAHAFGYWHGGTLGSSRISVSQPPDPRLLFTASVASNPVRLRNRDVLGGHQPGLLLVFEESPGKRAGRLRRRGQPCARHLFNAHTDGAGIARADQLLPDLARDADQWNGALFPDR